MICSVLTHIRDRTFVSGVFLYIENILCGNISYEEHSVPEIFDIERISH